MSDSDFPVPDEGMAWFIMRNGDRVQGRASCVVRGSLRGV